MVPRAFRTFFGLALMACLPVQASAFFDGQVNAKTYLAASSSNIKDLLKDLKDEKDDKSSKSTSAKKAAEDKAKAAKKVAEAKAKADKKAAEDKAKADKGGKGNPKGNKGSDKGDKGNKWGHGGGSGSGNHGGGSGSGNHGGGSGNGNHGGGSGGGGGGSGGTKSLVSLVGKDQGGSGDKGTKFRPVDSSGKPASFELSARSYIDQSKPFDANAKGSPGRVDIGPIGTGVLTADGKGSIYIEGGGKYGDEELIFNYDKPVLLHGIEMGLVHIDFGKGLGSVDDPVLFLKRANDADWSITLAEDDILAAFHKTGSEMGFIDFGDFVGLPGLTDETLITAMKIRETNGALKINFVKQKGMNVPEPTTWLLLTTLLVLAMIYKRRKMYAQQ